MEMVCLRSMVSQLRNYYICQDSYQVHMHTGVIRPRDTRVNIGNRRLIETKTMGCQETGL